MTYLQKIRGCWTCKQRKVACDKRQPVCERCQDSGRQCAGYGMRLSWPRNGDKRRTIISEKSAGQYKKDLLPWFLQTEFVNVSSLDVKLLYDMLSPFNASKTLNPTSGIPRNPRWAPFPFKSTEVDLLSYYHVNVGRLLTSTNNRPIQTLIFRMSFTDTLPSSTAVLFAIYALASLHLGDLPNAMMYRGKALRSIEVSGWQRSVAGASLQRIAAAYLLSMYETLGSANPRLEWAQSVCITKNISNTAYSPDQVYQGDSACILNMVCYNDILVHFGARHYKSGGELLTFCKQRSLAAVLLNTAQKTHVSPASGCSTEVLCTIADIVDIASDLELDADRCTSTLDKLERRLKYANQEVLELACDVHSECDLQQSQDRAELYRLAGMIYIHRLRGSSHSTSPVLKGLVTEAYIMFDRLDTCERTFPLFVIGCEARTDFQRATILRIIAATKLLFMPTVMIRMREYIERFWALFELDVDGDTDHVSMMTATISASDSLPAFI